jgi:16S rRNA (uracil1498-N3)-methyltransferase
MSDRFYSTVPITTEHATLDGPEAHHLLHVMRAKVGDCIVVFDGSGDECDAEVVRAGRAEVELRVLQRRTVDRELPFELVIGVSLPKGDRQKWLVEKLTELGVTTLVPLVTTRGVAQPTDNAVERLERSVIEAAKQCGRNRLMRIDKPSDWDVWLYSQEPNSRLIIANPHGTPMNTLDLTAPRTTSIAIGPEGGFSDGEHAEAIASGWQAVNLGERILRVETAAMALASVVALSARS